MANINHKKHIEGLVHKLMRELEDLAPHQLSSTQLTGAFGQASFFADPEKRRAIMRWIAHYKRQLFALDLQPQLALAA